MEEIPKVTVLLSVFNDQKYIGEAIESILSQTYKNFELLIIDDCSKDGTVEVINKFKDPRIRLVANEENIDISKSLNKGLSLARGKYIARHDSDDLSSAQRLQRQVEFLDKNRDYAAVGSRTEFIDEKGNNAGYWKQEVHAEEVFYSLSYRCCLTSSSMMFVKSTVISLGGYDESSSHAEDYELFFRLSRKHKIYVLPEYLVKYRIRENQRLSINYGPISDRTFEISSRTKIDKKLLKFLQNRSGEQSFFKRIRLIEQLNRFHKYIQNEGKKIGLSIIRLKLVCCRMTAIFIVKIIVGQKGKALLKKAFKMGQH